MSTSVRPEGLRERIALISSVPLRDLANTAYSLTYGIYMVAALAYEIAKAGTSRLMQRK